MRNTSALLLAGLVATGCGSRASHAPAPEDPAAAVTGFLAAVQANDQPTMGTLFGSADRGPAVTWMDREELRKRLTVIQSFLLHERFSMEPDNDAAASTANRVVLRVRLTRRGCTPVVPFTVVRYRGGWLVSAVDLEAAGSPARSCQ